VVSDGSYQDGHRAAAWTIESQMSEHQLWGSGMPPGSPSNQSAYHSELFGLWGIFMSLKQLTEQHQIMMGWVVVVCNGLSTLKKASKEWLSDPQEAHYDLISAIWNLCLQLPLAVTFQHIKATKTVDK